jgi:proteasome lid subunit RPN8/RPN11
MQEGLYTHGAEFMLPNGKIYIGDYHIHPGKGPMVGAVHSNEYHDTLTPLAESLKNLR